MKKAITILICLLGALTILYPTGVLITSGFGGYNFELISVSTFAVIIAVLSVCIVVLDLVFIKSIENKTVQILLAVITPISLINAVFYIFSYPEILVLASVFLSAVCCCILSIKHGKPLALKAVALILSVLMILPIECLSIVALAFGNVNTVVQTVESPDEKYYAKIIGSNQGTSDDFTSVVVCEKSIIDFLIFKVEKAPQQVYYEPWGEFNDMQIYWKNDRCLVINSVEYEIE